MTAPVLELHIKATGVQEVNALTAALNALEASTGNLGKVKSNLSSLDKMNDHLREMRNEMKQGFAALSQVMKDGMAGAFAAGNAAMVKGVNDLNAAFAANMQKTAASIAAGEETVAKKLLQANGKMAQDAATAGKKVGKEFADGVQSEVSKVKLSASVPLTGGARASMSVNGIGNLAALQKTQSEVQQNPAATAAAAEKENAARLAASLKMMAGAYKLAEAQAAASRTEEAAKFAAMAKLQVGSLRVAEAQAAAASREEAAKFGAAAKMQVGSLKIAEAQAAAASREESARFAAMAKLQVGSLKQAETIAAAAAREDAAWDKYVFKVNANIAKLLAVKKAEAEAASRDFKISGQVGQAMQGAGTYSSISPGSYGALRNVPKDLDDIATKAPKSSQAMKEVAHQMNQAHGAARGLASGFGALWLAWGPMLPLLAGAVLSTGFVQVIKVGAEVQNTLTLIKVLAGESAESVGMLNTRMLEMARSGQFGPRELAEGMKILALAGLDATKVYAALPEVLNFAVAGDTNIKQAADVMTTVATAFGVAADKYAYVGDTIAKAAAESKTSVEGMGEAFKTASVINKAYGVSLEDTAVGLALLANAGITNSAAGTSLRNMYADLSGRTPKVVAAMKELGVEGLDKNTGKMREQSVVFSELMASLAKRTPLDQAEKLRAIFSERGEKSAQAILDAMRRDADAMGTTVLKVYDDLKNKIVDAAGFTAIAAAEMSLTPLNQMKSVAAALQATLGDVFTSLQPMVVDMSSQLKELFGSENFKSSLREMVTMVGQLTAGIFENGRTILTAVAAYVGFRAVVGIMAAVSAATAAWGVATAGAVTAVGLATRAASLANPIFAVLTGVLTVATGAWAMYQLYVDRSKDSTDKFAGNSNTKALLDKLQEEEGRLLRINEARSKGISLMELEAQVSLASARGSMSPNQAKAKNALAQFDKENPNIDAPAVSKEAFTLLNRKRAERAALTSAQRAADEEHGTNLLGIERASKSIAALRQKDAESERKRIADEQAGIARGNLESAKKAGKAGKESGVGRIAYDNDRSTLMQALEGEFTLLRSSADKQKALLDEKHRYGLISEGTYQGEMMALMRSQEAAALDKGATTLEALDKEYASNKRKTEQEVKDSNQQQQLENLKNRWIVDREKAERLYADVRDSTSLKIQSALNAEMGETLKLGKVNEKFWEDAEAGVRKEEAVAQSRLDLAQMSETARARREAEIRVEETYSTKLSELEKGYATAQAALEDYLRTESAFSDDPDAVAAFDSMTDRVNLYAAALANARTKVDELKGTAGNTAENAVQDKINKDTRKNAKELSEEVSGKLSDAILSGGKDGFKGLKDWIKNYFIREPIKVLLQGVMQPIGNMVAQMAYPGAGALSGGSGGGPLDMLSGASSMFSAGMGDTMRNIGSIGSLANIGTLAAGGNILGAIGAAAPYIGIALLAISALAKKGGGPKTEAGYAAGGLDIAGRDIGGNMQGSQRGDVSAARGISEGISTSYETLAKQLGLVNKKLDVGIFYAMDNAKGGTSMTQLQVTSSSGYNRSSRTGGIENVARGEEELKKALAEETTRVLIDGLMQASDLAQEFKDIFAALGADAGLKEMETALARVTAARTQQVQLEEQFFQLTSNDSEKLLRAREKERAAVDPLNASLLEQVFAQQDLNTATQAATVLADQKKGLEQQIMQLTGNTAGLRQLELNAMDESLRPLQQRIYSLQDEAAVLNERKGLEQTLYGLLGDTAALRRIELSGLNASNRALQQRIYRIQDEQAAKAEADRVAQEAASAAAQAQQQYAQAVQQAQEQLASFTNSIRSYLDKLSATPAGSGSPESQLTESRRQFEEQLVKARAGDQDAMSGITGYADQYIAAGRGVYASGTGSADIISQVRSALSALPAQVSAQQQLIGVINTGVGLIVSSSQSNTAHLSSALSTLQSAVVSRLATEFDQLDTTLDGQLNFEEFLAGLQGLGTSEDLMAIFMELDANHDGQLSELELLRQSVVGIGSAITDRLASDFAALDTTLDGQLNLEEFIAGMQGLGIHEDLTSIFMQLDVNHDGQISQLESLAGRVDAGFGWLGTAINNALATNFTKLDTTLDGQLNFEEFQAGMSHLGTSDDLMKIFMKLDTNHDGQISELEAIAGSVNTTATDTSNGVVPTLLRLHSDMGIALANLSWTVGHVGNNAHSDAMTIYNQLMGVLNVRSENRNGSNFPTFATGGSHLGGARIVGEYGPELEITGPSRIYSNAQTRSMLGGSVGGSDNSEVVAEVKELRQVVSGLLKKQADLIVNLTAVQARGLRDSIDTQEGIRANTAASANAVKLRASEATQ